MPPMTIGHRTNCHFQSLLPLEVNDGGAAIIKEMNERNLGIQNKNEAIVVSDDENKKEKNETKAVNEEVKQPKIEKVLCFSDDENERKEIEDISFDTDYDSEEDKKIKSFKRNVFVINEEKNEFLGKNEKESKIKKPRFENIFFSNIEEMKDLPAKEEFNEKDYENTANFERTYSDESITSMNSCSSKISVKSENSDFININDLFSKPSAVKGNIVCESQKEIWSDFFLL